MREVIKFCIESNERVRQTGELFGALLQDAVNSLTILLEHPVECPKKKTLLRSGQQLGNDNFVKFGDQLTLCRGKSSGWGLNRSLHDVLGRISLNGFQKTITEMW